MELLSNAWAYITFVAPNMVDYWAPNKGRELAMSYKSLIIISTILYVPAILIMQAIMKNKKPFSIKPVVFVWNLLLSLFSTLGALLMLFDWRILFQSSFPEEYYLPSTRAVIALFTLTKCIEFGDTVLLVLKKKPLMFLHVYHHFSVSLYCWHAQLVNVSFAHHFAFLNLCIHGVMYMYYALSVVTPGNSLLRKFRPFVTLSQTLQMFIGMILSYNAISDASQAESHILNARIALAMYTSYAWLFAKFYLENFVKGVRPTMTLFVCTVHILAIIGFCKLWYHGRWPRLVGELFVCYCFTAFLMRFLIGKATTKLPIGNSSQERTKCNSEFDLYCGIRSAFKPIYRACLMFLNFLATWAWEHQTFWKNFESLNSYLNSDVVPTPNTDNNIEKTTPLSSKDDYSANKFQEPSKNSQKSLVLSLLMRSNTGKTEKTGSNPGVVLAPIFSISLLDLWFAVMSFGIPAIYGFNMYGDFLLGLCVHGCLRWIVELHTAGALIPKFDKLKRN